MVKTEGMRRIEAGSDDGLRRQVEDHLKASNDERSPILRAARERGDTETVPLEVYEFVGDDLVGGLTGSTHLRWLTIDLLWVRDDERDAGVGGRLLEHAERIASEERGCIGAQVQTWDFQARPFYEKHGYEVFGTLEDHPPGIADHHLAKRLD